MFVIIKFEYEIPDQHLESPVPLFRICLRLSVEELPLLFFLLLLFAFIFSALFIRPIHLLHKTDRFLLVFIPFNKYFYNVTYIEVLLFPLKMRVVLMLVAMVMVLILIFAI